MLKRRLDAQPNERTAFLLGFTDLAIPRLYLPTIAIVSSNNRDGAFQQSRLYLTTIAIVQRNHCDCSTQSLLHPGGETGRTDRIVRYDVPPSRSSQLDLETHGLFPRQTHKAPSILCGFLPIFDRNPFSSPCPEPSLDRVTL